jgi:N-acetylneuraminate synthase
MKISNRKIGTDCAPFVIAEMSGNHNQSLERALEIVDAAAASGAHALKIQTYTADTMTIDISTDEFYINDDSSLWKGNSLYDLYKLAYTPFADNDRYPAWFDINGNRFTLLINRN